jgi:hypothetical protein
MSTQKIERECGIMQKKERWMGRDGEIKIDLENRKTKRMRKRHIGNIRDGEKHRNGIKREKELHKKND